jgi:hypothetical protein
LPTAQNAVEMQASGNELAKLGDTLIADREAM